VVELVVLVLPEVLLVAHLLLTQSLPQVAVVVEHKEQMPLESQAALVVVVLSIVVLAVLEHQAKVSLVEHTTEHRLELVVAVVELHKLVQSVAIDLLVMVAMVLLPQLLAPV
jgi:hypothetical protein